MCPSGLNRAFYEPWRRGWFRIGAACVAPRGRARSEAASAFALGGFVRKQVRLALWLLVASLGLSTGRAEAQSFRLNRFRAAERPDDGFGVRRLGMLEHLQLSGLITADYAHDPLVLESVGSERVERARVVRHQLTLSLDVALALYRRLLVFTKLDLIPVLSGPPLEEGLPLARASGGGVGDLSLGARVRIVGEADDFFALGIQAALITPTARGGAYRGEEGVAVRPELLVELRPKGVRLSANLGTLVRREQQLLDTRIGSELTYGLAAGVPVHAMVELMAELWGGFSYADFARRATTPLEWLVGAKLHTERGLYASLGGGTGFTHGVGSPDGRLLVQLGFLAPKRSPEPLRAEPADRDGDGLSDDADRCPDQPEDQNGRDDSDGCPDADGDSDGVLDVEDGCPAAAEDRDGVQDDDGCPDPDNDGDGVLDVEDACPLSAGVVAERGCPEPVRFSEEGELIVLDQILFETNKAVILPESVPHLEAVKTLLRERPAINKLRIEGHTDTTGPAPRNQALSSQRAEAVRAWLVTQGVEANRLEAYGCGEQHPLVPDDTAEARAQNRRVVFQVVEPPMGDAPASEPPAGCVRVGSE